MREAGFAARARERERVRSTLPRRWRTLGAVTQALPSLKHPPIVEVVCGFFFEAMPGIDPMLVGEFGAGKKSIYTTHALKPPVSEVAGLLVSEGVGPLRCWLVSAGGEFVVQIQPDRFYFNWRRRGDVYPRFGTHEGKAGVLQRALDEFAEFTTFCDRELGVRPTVNQVELAKIDDVVFDTLETLSADLPLVAAIKPWTRSGAPEIHVKLADQIGDVDVVVTLSNTHVTTDLQSAVRVETRATRQVGAADPKAVFESLNQAVNDLFRNLFSDIAIARFRGDAP